MPFLLLDQYVVGAADNESARRRARRGGVADVRRPPGRCPARADHARPRPRPADVRAAPAGVERRPERAGVARAGPRGRRDPAARRRRRLVGHRDQRRRQQDRQLPAAAGELRRDDRSGDRRDDGDAARRADQHGARPTDCRPTSSATASGCRRARAACTCRSTARCADRRDARRRSRPVSPSARSRAGTSTPATSTSPPAAPSTFELRLAGTVADPTSVVTWTQPMANPLERFG